MESLRSSVDAITLNAGNAQRASRANTPTREAVASIFDCPMTLASRAWHAGERSRSVTRRRCLLFTALRGARAPNFPGVRAIDIRKMTASRGGLYDFSWGTRDVPARFGAPGARESLVLRTRPSSQIEQRDTL